MKGKIIVISAPSGAGKTTLIKWLLGQKPEFLYSVSATTRKRRSNEKNGIDYHFISEEEFIEKIKSGAFAEWEKVYDYYYGTFKEVIEKAINKGKTIIVEVDVKGALSIKKAYPEAKLIYIDPPSLEDLIERLRGRKTESESDFKKRIERAKMELSHKDKFDYLVVNEKLDSAKTQLLELINTLLKE